tara:strand:+ start:2925 stop:3242 length:318 start_codon:yes stop_codon:yes gene_type:complete
MTPTRAPHAAHRPLLAFSRPGVGVDAGARRDDELDEADPGAPDGEQARSPQKGDEYDRVQAHAERRMRDTIANWHTYALYACGAIFVVGLFYLVVVDLILQPSLV